MEPRKIIGITALGVLLILLFALIIGSFMRNFYFGVFVISTSILTAYVIGVIETNSFLPWKGSN